MEKDNLRLRQEGASTRILAEKLQKRLIKVETDNVHLRTAWQVAYFLS